MTIEIVQCSTAAPNQMFKLKKSTVFPLSWAEGLREPRALVLRPVKGNPKFARRLLNGPSHLLELYLTLGAPGYQP